MKFSLKFLVFILFFLLFPFFSFSQFQWELEYPWEPPRPGNLPDFLLYIYKFAVWGSGMVAMLMIIIGGVLYIISGDSPEKKADAKDRIKMALIGLILILGSYIILNTINPELAIIQLPRIRPAPDQKCIENCSGECDPRCTEIKDKCLALWKKDGECPLKNAEEEKAAAEILVDSCILTCNSYCKYSCKKNYWEWECKPDLDPNAIKVVMAVCDETEIELEKNRISYRHCTEACEKKKVPIENCDSCCFKSMFAEFYEKGNLSKACPAASLEAYIKTCKALKQRY